MSLSSRLQAEGIWLQPEWVLLPEVQARTRCASALDFLRCSQAGASLCTSGRKKELELAPQLEQAPAGQTFTCSLIQPSGRGRSLSYGLAPEARSILVELEPAITAAAWIARDRF